MTRLGWTLTKFNRKLDNVCQKLARHGVRGLHGSADRLVGYGINHQLVPGRDVNDLDENALVGVSNGGMEVLGGDHSRHSSLATC